MWLHGFFLTLPFFLPEFFYSLMVLTAQRGLPHHFSSLQALLGQYLLPGLASFLIILYDSPGATCLEGDFDNNIPASRDERE